MPVLGNSTTNNVSVLSRIKAACLLNATESSISWWILFSFHRNLMFYGIMKFIKVNLVLNRLQPISILAVYFYVTFKHRPIYAEDSFKVRPVLIFAWYLLAKIITAFHKCPFDFLMLPGLLTTYTAHTMEPFYLNFCPHLVYCFQSSASLWPTFT